MKSNEEIKSLGDGLPQSRQQQRREERWRRRVSGFIQSAVGALKPEPAVESSQVSVTALPCNQIRPGQTQLLLLCMVLTPQCNGHMFHNRSNWCQFNVQAHGHSTGHLSNCHNTLYSTECVHYITTHRRKALQSNLVEMPKPTFLSNVCPVQVLCGVPALVAAPHLLLGQCSS